jgi:hypothetical protein
MTLPISIVSTPSIDVSHQKIHEGNHFFIHKISLGINIASPKYYLIVPPPTAIVPSDTIEMHIIFEIGTDIGGTVKTFEGATITASGTELTIINNNRRSSTPSFAHIYEDPIIAPLGEGIQIFEERSGTVTAGTKIGESYRSEEEIILNPDKKYLIKFTPLADGANITAEINWYDNRPSSPVL